MNKIQVLDCTLRDGGYCNDWQFGERRVAKILKGLADSGIDIIECGFLTGRGSYVPGATKFTELSLLDEFLPPQRKGKQFVVMANMILRGFLSAAKRYCCRAGCLRHD